jgi:hypothetical protein
VPQENYRYLQGHCVRLDQNIVRLQRTHWNLFHDEVVVRPKLVDYRLNRNTTQRRRPLLTCG